MKKHCDLFCAGIWPFLIGPLLLLLPLLFFQWHPIEELVAANADQATSKAHPWAKAETYNRGREVLLTGNAPSQESVEQAIAAAKSAEGVRSVSFVGDVVTPKQEPIELTPGSMTATFQGDQVVLRGELDSQASISTLVAKAQQVFGPNRVRDELTVGENLLPTPDFAAALNLMNSVDNKAGVEFADNRLSLLGEVTSDEKKSRLGSLLTNVYSGESTNQLAVVAPQCQVTIKTLLAETKINFATGNAVIQDQSNQVLTQIAAAAKECSDSEFEVSGHTDSTGSAELNKSLSQRRADAVVNRLTELGLDRDRFTARGAGPSEPIADNNTSSGRAANRRIEFRVTN